MELTNEEKHIKFYEDWGIFAHKIYFKFNGEQIEFCSIDDIIEDVYYKNKVFSINSGKLVGDLLKDRNVFPVFVPMKNVTIVDKKIEKDVYQLNGKLVDFCEKHHKEGAALKDFLLSKLRVASKGYIDLYKKKYKREKLIALEEKVNYKDDIEKE